MVDIGTGRGELLVEAIKAGMARAIGVEYSKAALELARHTLEVNGLSTAAEVLQADARRVPLEDATADLVTMLDVVEHLAPHELALALAEVLRILRPGGRVFIHTMPNRTVYDITYRIQRVVSGDRRRRWSADPRQEIERILHVNEQTVASLRRALRGAGFEGVKVELGQWVYTEFVPDERARLLYHRLASHRLTARLGIGDLWAHGTKPASDSASR